MKITHNFKTNGSKHSLRMELNTETMDYQIFQRSTAIDRDWMPVNSPNSKGIIYVQGFIAGWKIKSLNRGKL